MEEYLQDIIENALVALGVSHSHIDIQLGKNLDNEDEYYCDIKTNEASLLIGKRGNNIAALEHLIKLVVFKRFDKNINLNLDADGYKTRQKEHALGVAERHISKLKETRVPQSLPPMQPLYRRVVHMHIANNHSDIATESHGHGKFRHIKIKLK